MDTRTKILSETEALQRFAALPEAGRLVVVCGLFDPLLADHAERLEQLAGAMASPAEVLVVITTEEPEILPIEARAELVAALAVVNYVVPYRSGPPWEFLKQIRAREIFDETSRDRQRKLAFIRHVKARHEREG